MNHEPEGVYLPTDDPDTYESTPMANAGWYEQGQHGGALAALITGHVDRIPTLADMQIARVTVEIFRVVPLVPLTIKTKVVREGKRIQKIRADVTDPEGTLLSMASIQRLRVADLPLPEGAETPDVSLAAPSDVGSFDPDTWGVGKAGKVMFHRNAIEIREIFGGFSTPGPGAIWTRLTKPIIAGRANSPVQRVIAAADFCNGVSLSLGDDWVFMNSDLTVHISRYPEGEWVALDAESHYSELGRGVAAGSLWDQNAWLGRSAQTLFLDHA
ncbi:MAG: thioesterase family protein [Actinomycetota bacterium]|nr:thioesterase family protein [Actinomycetota bacterium]